MGDDSRNRFKAIDPQRILSFRLLPIDQGADSVRLIVDMFVMGTREELARIRAAAERPDFADVRFQAHRLYGSAATFGALGLERLALQLVQAADRGSNDDIATLIPMLELELERVCEEIGQLMLPPG